MQEVPRDLCATVLWLDRRKTTCSKLILQPDRHIFWSLRYLIILFPLGYRWMATFSHGRCALSGHDPILFSLPTRAVAVH